MHTNPVLRQLDDLKRARFRLSVHYGFGGARKARRKEFGSRPVKAPARRFQNSGQPIQYCWRWREKISERKTAITAVKIFIAALVLVVLGDYLGYKVGHRRVVGFADVVALVVIVALAIYAAAVLAGR